jgi:hypothetical protein
MITDYYMPLHPPTLRRKRRIFYTVEGEGFVLFVFWFCFVVFILLFGLFPPPPPLRTQRDSLRSPHP